ncbi:UPF0158 family protein [Salsipaludibacter albus]|uniref:UPF0158 family protein n=1 Tax=Salsipaludibacter albus TaxID=2849650 RepID=UPI001EE49A06|nr:UPF0158 family protein [Salsipaludibacter albus]MBY5162113.1 hypothetical protein [Salsipaludibacter albus]
MARSWLMIRVELVGGRGEYWWPRPGREIVARRTSTFRELARAIDAAFGRWDLSHLHRFVLDDVVLVPLDVWDDPPRGAADDTSRLSILELGQQFAYEFDMGDGWEHLCTVEPQRVDPWEVLGVEPDRPTVAFGWGDLPDQYGRRFADDDGNGPLPDQPDPPTADLPPLLPHWGDWTPPTDDERLDGFVPMQDWDDESWRTLLGAVHRGDGFEVVSLSRTHDALEVAQLAGQGLLAALAQGVEEAWAMAWRLADDLRDRMGPGDDELADELDAVRGVGSRHVDSPSLRAVPVDLEELATHLEGDLLGAEPWYLDLETGQLWPDDPVGMTGEEPAGWGDDGRWLSITSIGSRDAWEDMRDYIDRIEDADLAESLERAIHGRGAFRRFKDELFRHEDLGRAFQRYTDDRQRGRTRAWLAMQGLRPARPGERDG